MNENSKHTLLLSHSYTYIHSYTLSCTSQYLYNLHKARAQQMQTAQTDVCSPGPATLRNSLLWAALTCWLCESPFSGLARAHKDNRRERLVMVSTKPACAINTVASCSKVSVTSSSSLRSGRIFLKPLPIRRNRAQKDQKNPNDYETIKREDTNKPNKKNPNKTQKNNTEE